MIQETIADIREFMSRIDADEEPYSPQQVADAYGFNVQHIYRECRVRNIRAPKIGKYYEITAEHLLDWRKKKTQS